MQVLVGTSDGPLYEGGNLRVTAAVLADDGLPLDAVPASVSVALVDEDGDALAGGGAMSRVDEDGGNPTAAASLTLTDSSQAWRPELWRGAVVQITAGPGAGQARRVRHNTATVLTVEEMVAGAFVGPWATTPEVGSTYALHRGHWARTMAVPAGVAGTTIYADVTVADPAGGDVVRRVAVRIEEDPEP